MGKIVARKLASDFRKGLLPAFVGSLVLIALAACASQPVRLPSERKEDEKFTARLESDGELVIRQRLKSATTPCAGAAKALFIEARKKGDGGGKVAYRSDCSLFTGYLAFRPQKTMGKGDYAFTLDEKSDGYRFLIDKPEIVVKYKNPEFASDTDQIPAGAKALAENQQVKDKVNASTGDQSDWVQVMGKDSQVQLTLLVPNPNGGMKGLLYQQLKGEGDPHFIGKLLPGKRRTVRVVDGNIFVRLVGDTYGDEVEYTLLRKDSAVTRVVRLAVVDSYRVSGTASVLLLTAVDGLKVKDEVRVSGKTDEGNLVPLGACRVTTIEGGQAACRLEAVPDSTIAEFKAEARLEG